MNTSAISSPVNLVPGNGNAAKPADAEEGASSFGETLSREMGAPAQAEGPENNPSRQATRSENTSAGANAQNTPKRNESTASATTGNTDAAKSDKARASAAKTEQDDDAERDAAASPAAEDLLALVASLTQSGVGRAGKTAQAAATDEGLPESRQTEQFPGLAALVPGQSAAGPGAGIPAVSGNTPATAGQSLSVAMDGMSAGRLRAAAMQSLGDRAQLDAAAGDTAADTIDPDARPVAPGDAQIAADQFAAKAAADAAASGKAESANPRFAAADGSFAKSLHDAQPAAPSATAIGAPAPAHLQTAGIHPAQLAPGHLADRLAPRVGTPGWDQALGQKVVWMVGGELQTASLTLNPPDLGPLQVVLSVSENQATANFTAAQAEVRQALEAAMPKLREMLGEAGIQLGQADVSAGTPDNQSNESAQSSRSGDRASAQDDQAEPQVRTSRIVTGGQGLVDTFA